LLITRSVPHDVTGATVSGDPGVIPVFTFSILQAVPPAMAASMSTNEVGSVIV